MIIIFSIYIYFILLYLNPFPDSFHSDKIFHITIYIYYVPTVYIQSLNIEKYSNRLAEKSKLKLRTTIKILRSFYGGRYYCALKVSDS